jgi:SAM-dependent methyltransferase
MHPMWWIPQDVGKLLDIGCNVGELLAWCGERFPRATLAGVDVNPAAIQVAKVRVPAADTRVASAVDLPFPDEAFDCITCIEVLEHIPAAQRGIALASMRRVMRRGGRLIVRVPHAGMFAWLDPNNARFRVPGLYRRLLGHGGRDAGYPGGAGDVVWHHHFTDAELRRLAGDGWHVETVRRGGLALVPLTSIAAWPFYRTRRGDSRMLRALQSMSEWDLGLDYGRWSYDLLLILRRI